MTVPGGLGGPMSISSSSERAGPSPGPDAGSPLSVELARIRWLRWLGVGLAALVLLLVLWAIAVRPAGVDRATILLVGLLVIAALYALDAVIAEWWSRRVLRVSAAQEQRRHDLAQEVSRLERVDLAARHLADADTLHEAAARLRAAAQQLVPARQITVLLRAADDLLVSVEGEDDGNGPEIGAGAAALASRALARGAPLRWSQGGGADNRSIAPRLAVPLRSSAEVVGVLVLERGADGSAFTHTEQRALERLAPHAGRALARVVPDGDRAAAPDQPGPPADAATDEISQPETVDLAVLVPAIADGPVGADGQPVRRVVVLAPTPAAIHTDPLAVATVLEELLRCVHEHAPMDSAMAVEVLAFDQQAEIVIAHGGGVLPEALLSEPRSDEPGALALRPAIAALGGTVSVRDRSGVPQVRVRLPVFGRSTEEVPVDAPIAEGATEG
ncbi:MAG: GAF domain-containing protein [Nitriliruptor sp.]|nr:MAG: GAF domain-containing protein [Nitriliruptor sp.]